jgi:Cu-Zn family superoxide dismutase
MRFRTTRKNPISSCKHVTAVAVITTDLIEGEVIASDHRDGVKIVAKFTKLPAGKHGFHIHKSGDLRGKGCLGLCEHYDVFTKHKHDHGDGPESSGERHTGDLGNIEMKHGASMRKTYYVKHTSVKELWGRSIIVHADEDDLGLGGFDDSKITGHSGSRIGCAVFGRGSST